MAHPLIAPTPSATPLPPPTLLINSQPLPPPSLHLSPQPLHHSKRKWSPCTWRYEIEEAQPELGSKPRRDGGYIAAAGSGHREREKDRERGFSVGEAHRRPDSSDDVWRPQSGIDHVPARQTPSRQPMGRSGIHKKQAQQQSRNDREDAMKKNANHKKSVQMYGEDTRDRVRRKKKESEKNRAEKERHTEAMPKRREREMTPSELYFCEICSARARSDVGSPCSD